MISGNIRFKLSLFITGLLAMTVFVFSLNAVKTMNQHILNEVVKRAESLSKSTAALAAYSILSQDLLGIDHIVSKVKMTNPDVEIVAVVGMNEKILAHNDIEKRGGKFHPVEGIALKKDSDGTVVKEIKGHPENIDVSTPVVFNNKQIGTVIIRINKSVLYAAQADTRKKIMAGLAISLSLGIACVIFLSSFITRPIKELSAGVDELKKGDRAHPLRVYSQDELGKLTESFNEMAAMIANQQDRLGKYACDLEEAYVSTVRVLAATIDARDPYTLGHSARVARLSLRVGESLGLNQEELEALEIACLFHDIGKLKTPDSVLLKKGAHNSAEYTEMIQHAEDGADILRSAPSLRKYIPAVRHHHEWYNGNGYPDRLRGEDIPLFAAIIAIADAFDAMTSTRPYRKALPKEAALEELVLHSGEQFDPALVEIFMKVIDGSPLPEDQPYSVEGVFSE